MNKMECTSCNGIGYEERELSGLGLRLLTCPKCNGKGEVKKNQKEGITQLG